MQVKTKERVQKFGEVFTAEREVKAMLDLVKHETVDIDKTFLEPACGDGNFLAEILSRKLNTLFRSAAGNDADAEYLAMRAISTIYGVDIQEDNVIEARDRLFDIFFTQYVNRYKHKPTNICQTSIRFILSQNVQCGNTLSGTTTEGRPLIITKWEFDENNGLTISLFSFIEMVRTGCECQPVRILPRIHYLLLPAMIKNG